MEKKKLCHLSSELTTHHMNELIIGMGYISGHVGRNIDGFQQGFMEDIVLVNEIKREGCC